MRKSGSTKAIYLCVYLNGMHTCEKKTEVDGFFVSSNDGRFWEKGVVEEATCYLVKYAGKKAFFDE